jgi:heptosyltransferase-2
MNYMGDALLTTPALSALREAHPDATIDTVVGDGAAASVLESNPDLNAIIVRGHRGSWGRLVQLYSLLRAGKYQEVVILPPLPAYGIAAYMAGTPVRVGLAGRGMDFFLTHKQVTSSTHMADKLIDTMRVPANVRSVARTLKAVVSSEMQAKADKVFFECGIAKGRPVVVLNVGATRKQKCWLPERFAEVIGQLDEADCVLVGAGSEDAKFAARVVAECSDKKAINLVDMTSVTELAAVLSRCDLLISADSGSMHLASAVSTPVVALFGSTDPEITGPYHGTFSVLLHKLSCSPCNNHPTCNGRFECMHEITADEVVLATRKLLREARNGNGMELTVHPPKQQSQLESTPSRPDSVKPRTQASRILIVTKFRFIGDTLVAVPIFRRVRELWPEAHITLLTGKNARSLLQNNPHLNEIIEFDPIGSDKGSRPFSQLVSRLRSERFDLCLTLNRSFHSALIPWLSGVRIRAGFDSEWRGMMLNRRVDYDREKSEIECYFDVLKAVEPLAGGSIDLELWVSAEESDKAKSLIVEKIPANQLCGRLIGIQPGASQEGKRWPVERFAELAEKIVQSYPDDCIVLIGGPDEVATSEAMLGHCSNEARGRIWSFVGATNLRISLALLSHLDVLIGNDTAIMHSAVALGKSSVALFGPTSSKKWGHYGVNDRVIASVDGQMTSISVEAVLAAVKSLPVLQGAVPSS